MKKALRCVPGTTARSRFCAAWGWNPPYGPRWRFTTLLTKWIGWWRWCGVWQLHVRTDLFALPMPSTLTTFEKPEPWRLLAGGLANATPMAQVPQPDFEVETHWTRFLADWCEPNQRAPRVGYLGDGEDREIVVLHNGLMLRSVFQPILST